MHDEPVLACPPSISYRLKKFVRRNKIAAAFLLILLISVAALTVSNIQTRRNEQRAITESAKAMATSNLLLTMLDSANPDQANGSEYTVRKLFDTISAGLGDQLKGQPEAEATIRLMIGNVYRRLNLAQQAQPHLETALKLRKEIFGDEHEMVAESQVALAWSLHFQDKNKEGEALVREALRFYENHRTAPQPHIFALWTLQCILNREKSYEEAAKVAEKALAIAGERPENEYPEVANILHNLATIRIHQKSYLEAEQLARRSAELSRRLRGSQHPEVAFALQKVGAALQRQGKSAEAEPPLRDALNIFHKYYRPDDTAVTRCSAELKRVLEALQDKSALEAFAKEEAEYSMGSDTPSNHIRLALLLLSDEHADNKRQEKQEEAQPTIPARNRTIQGCPARIP